MQDDDRDDLIIPAKSEVCDCNSTEKNYSNFTNFIIIYFTHKIHSFLYYNNEGSSI